MPDLTFRLAGQDDASGAMQSGAAGVRGVGQAATESAHSIAAWSEAYRLAVDVAKEAGKKFIEFTKESIDLAQKKEQADRRLAMSAGASTEAFKAQAEAFEKNLGVQSEAVEGIQGLLLQFGEAPAKVQGTTQAILDFAAATGQDATAAAHELLSGVQSGRGAFKEYGIQLHGVKDTTTGLASATAQLAAKFGGAAEGEAESFAGRVRALGNAFEDLQKSFGGFVMEIETRLGVLKGLADTIREIATGMNIALNVAKTFGANMAGAYAGGSTPAAAVGAGFGGLSKSVTDAVNNARGGGEEGGPLSAIGKTRATGMGSGEDSPAMKRREQHAKDIGDAFEQQQEAAKFRAGLFKKQRDEEEKVEEEEAADLERKQKEDERKLLAERKKALDEHIAAVKAKAEEAQRAGEQFGAAIVGGITSQLEQLMQGGKADPGEIFKSIFATIVQAGATLVGAIYGGPGGAALGGSVGGLAAAGIRSIGRHHNGDWIGAPRFHDGGGFLGPDERAAILQTGERVASRQEVSNAGGPGALDRVLSGGGGAPFVVMTPDAGSFTEYLNAGGGRAVLNARRIGRSLMDEG